MPLRINFYGGPGCGKSTLAAAVYAGLSRLGCRVELVQEWIKTWAHEGRTPQSFDQVYVCAKQMRREDVLLRNGVSIVTDSPLLLQLAYVEKYNPSLSGGLSHLTRAFNRVFPSLDLLLSRDTPYRTEGRYETEGQAEEMDRKICDLVLGENPSALRVSPLNVDGVLHICHAELRRHEEKNAA